MNCKKFKEVHTQLTAEVTKKRVRLEIAKSRLQERLHQLKEMNVDEVDLMVADIGLGETVQEWKTLNEDFTKSICDFQRKNDPVTEERIEALIRYEKKYSSDNNWMWWKMPSAVSLKEECNAILEEEIQMIKDIEKVQETVVSVVSKLNDGHGYW